MQQCNGGKFRDEQDLVSDEGKSESSVQRSAVARVGQSLREVGCCVTGKDDNHSVLPFFAG